MPFRDITSTMGALKLGFYSVQRGFRNIGVSKGLSFSNVRGRAATARCLGVGRGLNFLL